MSGTNVGRRRFLGLVGGAAASAKASTTAGAQETQVPVVSMRNDYFDPVGLYVEPGTTVRFEVEEGAHSATAYEDRIPSGAAAFDSGTMSEGVFEHTFETPGTYDYYCIPHEQTGMVGRVVVGEPGGPAEESTVPHGEVPESESVVEQGEVTVDEFGGSGGGRGRGMGRGIMGSGSRMMDRRRPGWMALIPVGFSAAILSLGVAGFVAYRATRKDEDDDER